MLSAEDIRWAFELVKSSIEAVEAGARDMMAGSEFEAAVQAVERVIAERGEEGIAHSHLLRAKGIGKIDERLLKSALDRLEAAERIWRIGPAGKRYRLKRPDECSPA